MSPRSAITPPDPLLCVCGNPSCAVPFGFCHCGCGEKAAVATQRHVRLNAYKGFPMRYANGHNTRIRPVVVVGALPFLLEGEPCRRIPVGDKHFTVVDESRYADLMQWKWFPRTKPDGRIYVVRSGSGRNSPNIMLHDQVLNPPIGKTADHKNGDSLDNRFSNLREATAGQQVFNRGPWRRKSCPYKGTRLFPSGKYGAAIKFRAQHIGLGLYDKLEDAAIAYDCAASILFKEFAWLNFPARTIYPEWTTPIRVKCERVLASCYSISR